MKTSKPIIKYLSLAFLFLILNISHTHAQRFAFVDTDYILEQIPEYRSAQQELNRLAERWRDQADRKLEKIDELYSKYQAEQALLPDEVRKQREEEIIAKEKELSKFKNDKFGREGELFKKREELIQPIQDKVFDAVQELARDAALDIIFDKSGAVTMLFANPRYDRSDEVLRNLGVEISKD
jgi:outer membrane protein